ncbi:guanylate cyclase 32E isoform X2 [Patella vulgata]|uniref:guanylate cyclase 32E isoform X2 n=1 Tax=Patella vulgata TaxID=6465 RepID=UPI0024A976DF|nr:guanylate cyclase 32E isoform X2 [Patella vulgata]
MYWCFLRVFLIVCLAILWDVISLVQSNNEIQANETLHIAFFSTVRKDADERNLLGSGPGMLIGGAFFNALDEVNAEYKNIHLNYTFVNTPEESWDTLREIADLYCDNTTAALIGPDGYCESAALAAKAFNLPYFAYGCHEALPSDQNNVYTFVSTEPTLSKVSKFIVALLKQYRWNSFSIVSGLELKWRDTAKVLETMSIKEEIHLNNITYDADLDFFHPGTAAKGSFNTLLENTKKKTRIYVFLGEYEALIEFARVMFENLGEDRKDYVLIGVDDRLPEPEHYRYFLHLPFEEEEEPNDGHLEPFRNVFILTLRPIINKEWPEFLNKTYQRNKLPPMNFPQIPPGLEDRIPKIPITVAYLYDAVKIYAKALNETLAANEDIRNPEMVIKKLRNRSYRSVQGFSVHIDGQGDNDGNYTLLSVRVKDGKAVAWMDSVSEYTRSINNSIPNMDLKLNINWLSGQQPPSEPQCGFQGEKCNTNWELAVIGSVLAAAVIVLLALGLVVLRVSKYYRYEKKLASLLWKIDREDLRFVDSVREFYSPGRQRKKVSSPWKFLLSGDNESEKRTGSRKEKQSNTHVGSYRGTIVFIKQVTRRSLDINREMKKQLQLRKELSHDNINRFIGACIELPEVYIVTQYCARESLRDILRNEDSQLDEMFVSSLVADLIKGMVFIHDSDIISHGNLTSSNCLVDSRWVLQIADFGLPSALSSTPPAVEDVDRYYEKLVLKAPELLRNTNHHPRGTQKADVYSFAIILYEIHGRKGPWGDVKVNLKDIVERVKYCGDAPPFRPDLQEMTCESYITSCIKDCWAEDPEYRPDFKTVRTRLKPMQQGLKANIFDNMLAMMEKYANNLEALVAERTDQLSVEKKMTENLLLRMLPRPVAEQLKRGQPVVPEQYECVSIYFSDIVGFTALSAQCTPMQVIDMLNDLYSLFDSILENYDVYKVETIGDAYVVVSGLPIRNHDNHAGEIASMSLHLLSGLEMFRLRHQPDQSVKIRIGIHSGPCCAGVVGHKMPRYCLFGDTVNTASRMESTGEALKIHCSQELKNILDKLGGYNLQERGFTAMKGKGERLTYFLVGEDKNHRIRRISTDKEYDKRCVSSGNPDYSSSLKTYEAFVNGNVLLENSESTENPPQTDKSSNPVVQADIRPEITDKNTVNSTIPKDSFLLVRENLPRRSSSMNGTPSREGSPQSDSTCSECEQMTFTIEDPNERKCLLKTKHAKQCHKVRKHNSMLNKKPSHVCDDFSQVNGSVPESIL